MASCSVKHHERTILDTETTYERVYLRVIQDLARKPVTADDYLAFKAMVIGRPGPVAAALCVEEFELPVLPGDFERQVHDAMDAAFASSPIEPISGAPELVQSLHAQSVPMAVPKQQALPIPMLLGGNECNKESL